MEYDTLLVDDNTDFRELLKMILNIHFPAMVVTEAGNCTVAWRRMIEDSPHIIFSDIKIHNEDGLELTRRIRHTFPDVVVAIMTGFDGPEYRAAAYANGADCFIPKNSVSLLDFVDLVKSIQSRRVPQWTLGSEYLNPAPPGHPWE